MQFSATLDHDHCWATPENEEMAEEWIANLEDRAADHGVDLHGAFATPSEHGFSVRDYVVYIFFI